MKDRLASIFRYSAYGLLGLGLSVSFAGRANAAPIAPTGFDRPPLVAIHWTTITIAAEKIETMVVIHAGGATEITELRDGQPARILRANPSPADFQAVSEALVTGQIGVAHGDCGSATSDGPIEYEITWYGQGTRFNTFKVGANLDGCGSGLSAMVDALVDMVNAVRPDPSAQKFPRGNQ